VKLQHGPIIIEKPNEEESSSSSKPLRSKMKSKISLKNKNV